MLRRLRLRAPLVLALTAAAAPAAFAQQPDAEIPRASRTYALTNARVVVSPGRVIERATVVVRDGLIANVGTNVRIPFDAQRIAGDSMTVYAGFVDALGQVGFAKPETPQNLPRVPNPDQPPRDRSGLEPDRRASAMLKADDGSIEAHRKAGFGAVHTVPYGGFLPGQGALLLLSGDASEALVLRDQTSLFATFQTARGVYPSTPMAIMAQWRTVGRETVRRNAQRDAYARSAAGRARPAFDPVTDALAPVVRGETPVFFQARSVLEAHRALRLKDELGLRMVLAGVPDAADMIDEIKGARVPLLLTLDLPKEPARADSTARDSSGVQPVGGYTAAFQIGTFANLAGERSNLESRVRATATAYTETAARLDRAGVSFAFTTIGMKASDVQKNVRRMIAAGLTEDVALAALTTRAAEIVGASAQLGTVERGKIANLVVTRGSYFDPKGAIRLVFVDGMPYRYEAPAATAAAGRRGGAGGGGAVTPGVRAAGTWSYEVDSPQGVVGGTLTITGSGNDLGGTITNSALGGGPIALDNVALTGDALSFGLTAPQMGALSATVTISGDTFSGTITIPGAGAVSMTGSRRPN